MLEKGVRKAVIPAAGLGTRFLPASKGTPKELLPILDTPSIQYVVEEIVRAGVKHIITVTSRGKGALQDYFDRSPELESALEKAGKLDILDHIRRITSVASFSYVRQQEPRGLGHAVLQAKALVGNEPFAVVLPDDIITSEEPVLGQMLKVHEEYKASVVAVEEVPWEQVSSYGIVDGEEVAEGVYAVRGLVEKPALNQAPSNLAIVGRYILDPAIFQALEETPPGAKGEIQLTDGMARMLGSKPLYALRFQGSRYDTGNPLGLLRATLELGLQREEFRDKIAQLLRDMERKLSSTR